MQFLNKLTYYHKNIEKNSSQEIFTWLYLISSLVNILGTKTISFSTLFGIICKRTAEISQGLASRAKNQGNIGLSVRTLSDVNSFFKHLNACSHLEEHMVFQLFMSKGVNVYDIGDKFGTILE